MVLYHLYRRRALPENRALDRLQQASSRLVTISCGFWCLFELENVRLQNWFYINVPSSEAVRFSGYFLAFGTVIPAIYLTAELIGSILPLLAIRPFRLRRYGTYAVPLGIFCLLFSLAFPVYCFSLAWVFLAFIIDGYNYRKGYASLAGELERGSLNRIAAVACAGLVCGIFWEFWNYWAVTKWIYTVPFFESFKLFEMPAPGFLGFPLLALETAAFLTLMGSSPFLAGSRWLVCAFTLAFCLAAFVLIDRYTVFSRTASVAEPLLPFRKDEGGHREARHRDELCHRPGPTRERGKREPRPASSRGSRPRALHPPQGTRRGHRRSPSADWGARACVDTEGAEPPADQGLHKGGPGIPRRRGKRRRVGFPNELALPIARDH